MKLYRIVMLLVLGAVACVSAWASELVYTPVNPTFGGSPSNQAGLMSAATAQNDYKAPTTVKTPLTPLEKFTQTLQNALTSRLSTATIGELFDSNGKPVQGKTLTAGQFSVTFGTDAADSGILTLTVSDTKNGGAQTIQIGNLDAFNATGQ
jgi:curli production assembly/transport component CsgF